VTEHADRTYRTNPAEWGANLTGHITADAARRYSTWQTKRRLSLLIRVKNRFVAALVTFSWGADQISGAGRSLSRPSRRGSLLVSRRRSASRGPSEASSSTTEGATWSS